MNVHWHGWNIETLSVGDLKRSLAEFPDDMAVLATWEGIHTPFRAPVAESNEGVTVVTFDVDQ
jgi:hypothetical protein